MNPHISEEYDAELSNARSLLMEMGGLVERQVQSACQAFIGHDAELAEQVSANDGKVNHLERDIDEQCIQIIARRQPAATDLRTLISIMNASTDLERIGDEADRIAKMARASSGFEIPSDQYNDFREMTTLTSRILASSLDAFARQDAESAVAVIESDEHIDDLYDEIMRNRAEAMRDQIDDIDRSMNVLWCARALERIGDHSKNIGEYVVYLVKGQDVRHADAAAAVADS